MPPALLGRAVQVFNFSATAAQRRSAAEARGPATSGSQSQKRRSHGRNVFLISLILKRLEACKAAICRKRARAFFSL